MELVKLLAFGSKPAVVSVPGGELKQLPMCVGPNARFLRSDSFQGKCNHLQRRKSGRGIADHGEIVKVLLEDGAYCRIGQEHIALVHVVEQTIIRVDVLEVVDADWQAMEIKAFSTLSFTAASTRSGSI